MPGVLALLFMCFYVCLVTHALGGSHVTSIHDRALNVDVPNSYYQAVLMALF